MMRALVCALLVLGCSSNTAPSPVGSSARSVDVARPVSASATASGHAAPTPSTRPKAKVRRYLSFPGKRADAPLLLFLHGYGSRPEHAAEVLELPALAKALDVRIVVPEGTLDKSGARFWHANGACCDFDRTGIDDVAALRAVLEDALATSPAKRRYVIGFSNGGFMAHRLACDVSDLIDGFAAVAGVGFAEAAKCRPEKPLRMLQMHATADVAVRYEGGHVLSKRDMQRHPGAVETVDFWVKHNGCTAVTRPAPPHAISGKETTVRKHSSCSESAGAEATVALWTVKKGNHLVGIDRKTMAAAIRYLLEPS